MRKLIFGIINNNQKSIGSKIYDYFMLCMIVLSIIPLAFRSTNYWFEVIDKVSAIIFIVDYLLRWITADLQFQSKSAHRAFLLYPFTPFAVIDLLSILPSITMLNGVFKLLRITRLLKILRVFRFIRYSQNIQILIRVLKKESSILLTVLGIAIGYVILTALIMFNVEDSQMFADFFDALYWATTTLTTVGYGDICPQTEIGRAVSMLSALMGVAIIALPSGVITASYLEELRKTK